MSTDVITYGVIVSRPEPRPDAQCLIAVLYSGRIITKPFDENVFGDGDFLGRWVAIERFCLDDTKIIHVTLLKEKLFPTKVKGHNVMLEDMVIIFPTVEELTLLRQYESEPVSTVSDMNNVAYAMGLGEVIVYDEFGRAFSTAFDACKDPVVIEECVIWDAGTQQFALNFFRHGSIRRLRLPPEDVVRLHSETPWAKFLHGHGRGQASPKVPSPAHTAHSLQLSENNVPSSSLVTDTDEESWPKPYQLKPQKGYVVSKNDGEGDRITAFAVIIGKGFQHVFFWTDAKGIALMPIPTQHSEYCLGRECSVVIRIHSRKPGAESQVEWRVVECRLFDRWAEAEEHNGGLVIKSELRYTTDETMKREQAAVFYNGLFPKVYDLDQYASRMELKKGDKIMAEFYLAEHPANETVPIWRIHKVLSEIGANLNPISKKRSRKQPVRQTFEHPASSDEDTNGNAVNKPRRDPARRTTQTQVLANVQPHSSNGVSLNRARVPSPPVEQLRQLAVQEEPVPPAAAAPIRLKGFLCSKSRNVRTQRMVWLVEDVEQQIFYIDTSFIGNSLSFGDWISFEWDERWGVSNVQKFNSPLVDVTERKEKPLILAEVVRRSRDLFCPVIMASVADPEGLLWQMPSDRSASVEISMSVTDAEECCSRGTPVWRISEAMDPNDIHFSLRHQEELVNPRNGIGSSAIHTSFPPSVAAMRRGGGGFSSSRNSRCSVATSVFAPGPAPWQSSSHSNTSSASASVRLLDETLNSEMPSLCDVPGSQPHYVHPVGDCDGNKSISHGSASLLGSSLVDSGSASLCREKSSKESKAMSIVKKVSAHPQIRKILLKPENVDLMDQILDLLSSD